MKANELSCKDLMVGDWVSPLGLPDIKVQVKPEDYINLAEYEPIPLTEEILKVNGFEEVVGEKGMYGVTISTYFKRDDSPKIFCDGNPFAVWFEEPVDIKYVHQLQHVLRLCGSNKEIIL